MIQNLPVALKNKANLETLNMSGCRFTEFPEVLCNLKFLKTLDIGGNSVIRNLPETLEYLTNLETLNVSGCKFTEFPEVLCSLNP